jgi:hypothetical protein
VSVAGRLRKSIGTRLAARTHTGLLLRATTGLVLALASLAGWMVHSCPQARTAPESVNLAGVVRWTDQPAPRYRPPTPPPPRVPAGSLRACTAGDVTASLGARTGAGGHVVRYVRFRNTSRRPACSRDTRTSRRPNPAFRRSPRQTGASSRLLEMRTCDRATSRSWAWRPTPTCPARPGGGPLGPAYHHLEITLPGAGSVAVTVPRSGGFDVTCADYA